jgi:hypothetical protein
MEFYRRDRERIKKLEYHLAVEFPGAPIRDAC